METQNDERKAQRLPAPRTLHVHAAQNHLSRDMAGTRVLEQLLAECLGDDAAVRSHLQYLIDALNAGQLLSLDASSPVIAKWIKRVNVLLASTSPDIKFSGVLLLETTVRQSTPEVFVNHCLSWTGTIVRLMTREPHNTRMACSRVARDILSYGSKHAELKRDISSMHLPPILKAALDWLDEDSNVAIQLEALTTLAATCRHFPGATKPFGDRICAKAQHACFASPDRRLREAGAKCFSAAVCTGPPKTITDAWKASALACLGSLHTIVTLLFGEILEDQKVACTLPVLELREAPLLQPLRTSFLVQQFGSLALTLQALLSEAAVGLPVEVPAANGLALICRVAALDMVTLSTVSHRDAAFAATAVAPLILSSLGLIEALLVVSRNDLLLHHDILGHVFIQLLERTKPTESSSALRELPYGLVRERTYAAMTQFVACLGSALALSFVEEVVKFVIGDLRVLTTVAVAELQTLSQSNIDKLRQGVSLKQRNAAAAGGTAPIGFAKAEPAAGSNLCRAILVLAYELVLLRGPEMTRGTRENLDSFILRQLSSWTHTPRSPFDDPTCRKLFYQVLVGSLLSPSHLKAPPLSQALVFLNTGLVDSDPDVVRYCRQSLYVCDALVHPRGPSIRRRVVAEYDTKEQGEGEGSHLQQASTDVDMVDAAPTQSPPAVSQQAPRASSSSVFGTPVSSLSAVSAAVPLVSAQSGPMVSQPNPVAQSSAAAASAALLSAAKEVSASFALGPSSASKTPLVSSSPFGTPKTPSPAVTVPLTPAATSLPATPAAASQSVSAGPSSLKRTRTGEESPVIVASSSQPQSQVAKTQSTAGASGASAAAPLAPTPDLKRANLEKKDEEEVRATAAAAVSAAATATVPSLASSVAAALNDDDLEFDLPDVVDCGPDSSDEK